MFESSWFWLGMVTPISGVIVMILLCRLALHSSKVSPSRCSQCEQNDQGCVLQHDWNCPLRLAYFGGQPHWDQSKLQLQNGVTFYFDYEVGSWRPQLWSNPESYQPLEK